LHIDRDLSTHICIHTYKRGVPIFSVYIYMYTNICLYTNIRMMFAYIYRRKFVYTHIYIHIKKRCTYICNVFIYGVSIFSIYIYIYTNIYLYICIGCLHVYIDRHLSTRIYIHTYKRVVPILSVYIYMYTNICL